MSLTEGMAFDTDVGGHHLTIDASAEHGGADAGPPPKALMLSALAGCAAMDVVSILRKMRAEPDALEVRASADLTAEHPRTFTGMHVEVRVRGDVPTAKLWKAVALSRDRYCGVAAMLRAHGPIAYTVVSNDRPIPEPTRGGARASDQ